MSKPATYDVAVIGAGTAGLVAAFVADSLGARTALIERERVGGECLWTGCVPSKTLIKSAKVFATMQRAAEFGVHVESPRLVWPAVRLRIAAVRDEIKALERAELQRSNIEVVAGSASFVDGNTLHIVAPDGEHTVTARRIILATGSTVRLPALDGLSEVEFLTHENIYDVANLPRSLLILGGGPIACEFAQAFARFGTKVTIVQREARLLPKEDDEVSAAALRLLEQDGVTVHLGATTHCVHQDEHGVHLDLQSAGNEQTVRAARLLVATGKQATTGSLNLGAAGIDVNHDGIVLDEHLRTTSQHVWACGDVTGKLLFTHVAEYQGKLAAQNALLPVKAKANYRVVPWTTFTDPEIARVGLTEAEARKEYGDCKVWRSRFGGLDRAIIEGETEGFLKVVTGASGRILGAHIVGPSAGELIHAFVAAVRDGMLIQEMAETIHVYPTLSEIGHRAGNDYYKELLGSAAVRNVLKVLRRTW